MLLSMFCVVVLRHLLGLVPQRGIVVPTSVFVSVSVLHELSMLVLISRPLGN